MAIDTTSPRSRRALLTAAVGGAAAAAAASIVRIDPTSAANSDPVLVGKSHSGTAPTSIESSATFGSTFRASHASDGTALSGFSPSGTGIIASTNTGHALVVDGRMKVEPISGIATIRRGWRSVTLDPGVEVNADTFVLLTPMANIGTRGLWFTKVSSKNKIVIRMSSARQAHTKIAWLALERA